MPVRVDGAIGEGRYEELERELAEARLALKRRAEFIASLSHEIRTPLTGVIGVAEMLMDGLAGELTEAQRRFVEKICESGQHLLELLNRTLDLSRMSFGEMDLALEELDLGLLIEQVVSSAQASAIEKRQTIEFLPFERNLRVEGDALRLRQVLMNLVSNACKYTPEGSHIVVSMGPGEPGFALVSVADDGPGIPAERLERIFMPFERGGDPDAPEGTGLGLAICKKIVELHGGRMWVESEGGKGTTFSFTVRLARPSDAQR